MAAVRDTAVVRPVGVVDGTRRRMQKPRRSNPMPNPPKVAQVTVRQDVMRKCAEVGRPGETLVILSETLVYLVPRQFAYQCPKGWLR